jgi:hypothetical protein
MSYVDYKKYTKGMKSLLVYVKPRHKPMPSTIYKTLKVQIDNCLDLGWAREDIILATNFAFQHNNVKAYILQETCEYAPFFNKQYAIAELMLEGILDRPVFYHDLDAYQVIPFDFPNFEGDFAACLYPKFIEGTLLCGTMYLKLSSIDMIVDLVTKMKQRMFNSVDDEQVIRYYFKNNPQYSERVSILDSSWNMGLSSFVIRYQQAKHPIKVLHFHPEIDKHWEIMVEGKNELNVCLLDPRLNKLMKKYQLK